ncbi:MAG: DUF3108 domain-containing protein [Desulfobacter sp.]|nr:MAG: DUF3108 domain-containing protein [Desulfobacter sp.]
MAGLKSPSLPFAPGEEIRYDVRWQMYRAGEARVRVLPFTQVNGSQAWHFELMAESNKFIDLFFKVRDHIQGFVDGEFTGSVGYRYAGMGKKKKEIRVAFSPDRTTAAYSNFNEHRDPIDIPQGSFDPLSSYFKMRCFSLGDSGTLSFPVTDGKKAFIQKGDIVGRERIILESGEYDTVVVVPWVTHFSGVFKKSKDPTVRVWITDDARKIPVRIRIKVVVGAIYFDLAGYAPGQR